MLRTVTVAGDGLVGDGAAASTDGRGLLVVAAACIAMAVFVRGVRPRGRLPDPPDTQRRGALPRRAQPTARPRPGHRVTARLRRRRELDLVALLSALAAELEAGQPTGAALDAACRSLSGEPCARALAAARLGGDVAAGLRADAQEPGCSGLRLLAACWEVAGSSGAGLAASVRRLAEAERSSRLARADLMGEVAAVRASARLLAGLPLLGLGLGMAMGASPVAWLLGSTVGRVTLIAGLVLQALGLLWLDRIVRRVRMGIP
jgi:tight adherence protein B